MGIQIKFDLIFRSTMCACAWPCMQFQQIQHATLHAHSSPNAFNRKKKLYIKKWLTTGLVKSPNSIHKSLIVCKPTNKITNRPTNLTLMVHDIIIPVNKSQHHHLNVNVWRLCVAFDTLTMPITDAVIKHSKIGSNKIYWFKVTIPTSNST